MELTLDLSTLSTEVQVTAETPLLNTESATLSHVVTNEQIVDLPLNGRGLLRTGAADAGRGAAAADRKRADRAAGSRERQRHRRRQRCSRRASCSTAWTSPKSTRAARGSRRRSTRCRSSASSRTPTRPNSTAPARTFNADHQVGIATSSTAACSSSCATTRSTRGTSSPRRRRSSERNQFGGTLGGPVSERQDLLLRQLRGPAARPGQRDVNVIVPDAAQRAGDFRGRAPIFDPSTTADGRRRHDARASSRATRHPAEIASRRRRSSSCSTSRCRTPPGGTFTPIRSRHSTPTRSRFGLDQQISARNRLFVALQPASQLGGDAGRVPDARIDAACRDRPTTSRRR